MQFIFCFFRRDVLQPPTTLQYSYFRNMVLLSILILFFVLDFYFYFPLLPFDECQCLKLLFYYFHYFKEKMQSLQKTDNVDREFFSFHFWRILCIFVKKTTTDNMYRGALRAFYFWCLNMGEFCSFCCCFCFVIKVLAPCPLIMHGYSRINETFFLQQK